MMKYKLMLVFMSMIILLSVSVYAATNINSCGSYAVAGETYLLNESFEVSTNPSFCITLDADDIVLDCQGHSIIDTNSTYANERGIDVSSQDNVTVKNCVVTNWNYATHAIGSTNSYFINNTFNTSHAVSNDAVTMRIYDTTGMNWINNTVENKYFGLAALSGNTFHGVVLDGNNFSDVNYIVSNRNGPSYNYTVRNNVISPGVSNVQDLLDLENANNILVEYNTFVNGPNNNSQNGIVDVRAGSNNITIQHNIVGSENDRWIPGSDVFLVTDSDNVLIYNNTIWSNEQDARQIEVLVTGGSPIYNISVVDNWVNTLTNAPNGHQIGVGSESAAAGGAHNVLMEGNYIKAPVRPLDHSLHTMFMGHVFSNGVFKDNTVINGGYGLVIKGNDNALITGNTIQGSSRYHIYDKANEFTNFTHNTIIMDEVAGAEAFFIGYNNVGPEDAVNNSFMHNTIYQRVDDETDIYAYSINYFNMSYDYNKYYIDSIDDTLFKYSDSLAETWVIDGDRDKKSKFYVTTDTNEDVIYYYYNFDKGIFTYWPSVIEDIAENASNTMYIVFAAFGLMALFGIVASAFVIVNVFNRGANIDELLVVGVATIGLAIVLIIGYVILALVRNSILLGV